MAAATVFSAIGVCVSRTVVRMAIWLFCALGGVAMLYFLLAATFIGAIQLIVYSGGTLILLVFGVMLTSKSPWIKLETPKGPDLAEDRRNLAVLRSLIRGTPRRRAGSPRADA